MFKGSTLDRHHIQGLAVVVLHFASFPSWLASVKITDGSTSLDNFATYIVEKLSFVDATHITSSIEFMTSYMHFAFLTFSSFSTFYLDEHEAVVPEALLTRVSYDLLVM